MEDVPAEDALEDFLDSLGPVGPEFPAIMADGTVPAAMEGVEVGVDPEGGHEEAYAKVSDVVALQVSVDGLTATVRELLQRGATSDLAGGMGTGVAQQMHAGAGQLQGGAPVHGPSGVATAEAVGLDVMRRERSPATEATHAHATPANHAMPGGDMRPRKAPALNRELAAKDPRVLKWWFAELTKGLSHPKDVVKLVNWEATTEEMLWVYEFLDGHGDDGTLDIMRDEFMKRYAGQVRPERMVALERLISGDIKQGSGSVAEYYAKFEAVRRLLPDESPASMCKHFVRGLSYDMQLLCCLDRNGHEWTDVKALADFAMGEERRLNLAHALVSGQGSGHAGHSSSAPANLASRVLNRAPPPPRFLPWKAQGEGAANKRPAQGAVAAASEQRAPKKTKGDASYMPAVDECLGAQGAYLTTKPRSEWVQAPMGRATETMPDAEYQARMPKDLRPAEECPFFNYFPHGQKDKVNHVVMNEVLRHWWICTFCRRKRHARSACGDWVSKQTDKAGPSNK